MFHMNTFPPNIINSQLVEWINMEAVDTDLTYKKKAHTHVPSIREPMLVVFKCLPAPFQSYLPHSPPVPMRGDSLLAVFPWMYVLDCSMAGLLFLASVTCRHGNLTPDLSAFECGHEPLTIQVDSKPFASNADSLGSEASIPLDWKPSSFWARRLAENHSPSLC